MGWQQLHMPKFMSRLSARQHDGIVFCIVFYEVNNTIDIHRADEPGWWTHKVPLPQTWSSSILLIVFNNLRQSVFPNAEEEKENNISESSRSRHRKKEP